MTHERAAAEARIREEQEERQRQAAAEKALAETHKREERAATDKIRLLKKEGAPQPAAAPQPTATSQSVAVIATQEQAAQPDHAALEKARLEEAEQFRLAVAGNTEEEESDAQRTHGPHAHNLRHGPAHHRDRGNSRDLPKVQIGI